MKKLVLIFLALVLIGGTASAIDLSSFPDPIEPGSIMVSPTFNFGRYGMSYAGATGANAFGASVSADYALPIPLTVGAEGGIYFVSDGYGSESLKVIPIFGRVAWHPNFEVDNLDVYLMIKAGYSVVLNDGFVGAFSYGGSIGARYFFTSFIGAFLELGYDNVGMKLDASWFDWKMYIRSFVHAGVTFKF